MFFSTLLHHLLFYQVQHSVHSEERVPSAVRPANFAEAEAMGFEERMEAGFCPFDGNGIDYFMGLASVLVRIGEAFADGGGGGAILKKDASTKDSLSISRRSDDEARLKEDHSCLRTFGVLKV